jgi:hypothetical protein
VFLIALAVGCACGILSGFGIGGGSLLMVWLTAVLSVPQRTAQGVNLLYFLPTAAAAVLLHAKHQQVQWRAVLPAAVGGCLASFCASYFAVRMHTDVLRTLFAVFLILISLRMFRFRKKP